MTVNRKNVLQVSTQSEAKFIFENLAPLAREMEVRMGKNELLGYESLVNNLKQMIQQKQYRMLQMVNSETINLYWEIGEKTYRRYWLDCI